MGKAYGLDLDRQETKQSDPGLMLAYLSRSPA